MFKIGVLGDLIVKLRICVVALFDIICCGGLGVVLCSRCAFCRCWVWRVDLLICVVGCLCCWFGLLVFGALRIGLLVVLVVVGCGVTC